VVTSETVVGEQVTALARVRKNWIAGQDGNVTKGSREQITTDILSFVAK
jgi:hypothetical protein